MKIEKHKFGTLTIGDRFIIGEMKEGSDIHLDTVSRIIDIANSHFKGERWGYISNRINSYSLQPLVYRQASEFEKNMVAFAVVTSKKSALVCSEMEKSLVGERFEFSYFRELDKAIAWVKSVISSE